MPPTVYNKPFLDGQHLVAQLQGKGLAVASPTDAEELLNRMNYYRFKAYLHPFLVGGTKQYAPSADFQDGLQLYRFDEELRGWIFTLIGRLEIKLRSRLDQVVTEHTGNPFWYLDDNLFVGTSHQSVQQSIDDSFSRSRLEFVVHYKANYINDKSLTYPHLPPFWMAAELTTFGDIRTLYLSLDKAKFNVHPGTNKLDDLAGQFGAPNLRQLNGWLEGLRDIRNRCAHHSRLWNSNYRAPGHVLSLIAVYPAPRKRNRIYLALVVLNVMLNKMGIGESVRDGLLDLFKKYPLAANFSRSMGMPANWETDPVWV